MVKQDVGQLGVATVALIASEAALAHFGMPGVLLGGAAAWAAYEYSGPLVKKLVERDTPAQPTSTKSTGKPPLAHRLFVGKSARRASAPTTDDFDAAGVDAWGDENRFDESFELSDLLASGWRPSYDEIFLARLTDGSEIFVSVEQLVHIALAGSTRQGKTSIIRQLLAQLCYIGCCCILLDPHYTPYDIEINEDWTPYTPYLRFDPMECKRFSRMEQILKYAATTVLESRKKLREQSRPVGVPIFIVIDEYPAIVAEIPEIQKHVALLLRQGAKYKIFLCVASQDFQVKTVAEKTGGGIRDSYKTCLYVGGDATTAKVLLDTSVEPKTESILGKGPVMLRCAIVKQASLAYTAFTDNQALYSLLGPSTFKQEDGPLASNYQERDYLSELDDGPDTEGLTITPAKSRSVLPDTPTSEKRPVLSVVSPSRSFQGASEEYPDNDESEPVEPAESTPGAFLPRGDDLLLSELQAELLVVHYRHCGNVNKSLEQIKNDKGQGLGGRYCRHASWILEQRGLKKRRA